ncbi:MAG: c-type cytochrome [Gallionella sp.]
MKSIIACMATAAGLMSSGSVLAYTMPEEVKQLPCLSCHAVDHKVIGPAWRDVGKKYKGAKTFEYNGKQYPVFEGLVKKVSYGGSGHWGAFPMPANDPTGIKKDKIEKMVKFVLSLG